jgi:hypothetical protein
MMGGGMAELAVLLMAGRKCSEPQVENSLCEPASNKAEDGFFQLLLRKISQEGVVGELPGQLGGFLVSMQSVSAENGVFAPVSSGNGGNAAAEHLVQRLLPENTDFAGPQLLPVQEGSAIAVEEVEDAVIRLVNSPRIPSP